MAGERAPVAIKVSSFGNVSGAPSVRLSGNERSVFSKPSAPRMSVVQSASGECPRAVRSTVDGTSLSFKGTLGEKAYNGSQRLDLPRATRPRNASAYVEFGANNSGHLSSFRSETKTEQVKNVPKANLQLKPFVFNPQEALRADTQGTLSPDGIRALLQPARAFVRVLPIKDIPPTQVEQPVQPIHREPFAPVMAGERKAAVLEEIQGLGAQQKETVKKVDVSVPAASGDRSKQEMYPVALPLKDVLPKPPKKTFLKLLVVKEQRKAALQAAAGGVESSGVQMPPVAAPILDEEEKKRKKNKNLMKAVLQNPLSALRNLKTTTKIEQSVQTKEAVSAKPVVHAKANEMVVYQRQRQTKVSLFISRVRAVIVLNPEASKEEKYKLYKPAQQSRLNQWAEAVNKLFSPFDKENRVPVYRIAEVLEGPTTKTTSPLAIQYGIADGGDHYWRGKIRDMIDAVTRGEAMQVGRALISAIRPVFRHKVGYDVDRKDVQLVLRSAMTKEEN